MPAVTVERAIVLRYPDPQARLAGVALVSELFKREPPRRFTRQRPGDDWELRLTPPEADRIEYQLELRHRNGRVELVLDRDVPTAPGPFGKKSVLERPSYRHPAWLDVEAPEGDVRSLELRSRRLRGSVAGVLWSPARTPRAEPLPLLVVHDGPEYAAYSELARFLEVALARGRIPPLRAALLAPLQRDEHYSASARYTAALADELLPALASQTAVRPGRRWRVGMGASLGALAMLHGHRLRPETFGGLFLQSGSFFRQRYDHYERDFPRFGRIARFVGTVLRASSWADPVPVGLTTGTAEENRFNNRAAAAALQRQGYDAVLHEVRDAHNWIAWRDGLDPHLVDLLERVWT
jgi:enterochelin esterase-like enzyme